MTIKEKLCEPLGKFYIETSKELEEIADDYAVSFAEWICRKSGVPYIKGTMYDKLKIFKKEKQL